MYLLLLTVDSIFKGLFYVFVHCLSLHTQRHTQTQRLDQVPNVPELWWLSLSELSEWMSTICQPLTSVKQTLPKHPGMPQTPFIPGGGGVSCMLAYVYTITLLPVSSDTTYLLAGSPQSAGTDMNNLIFLKKKFKIEHNPGHYIWYIDLLKSGMWKNVLVLFYLANITDEIIHRKRNIEGEIYFFLLKLFQLRL